MMQDKKSRHEFSSFIYAVMDFAGFNQVIKKIRLRNADDMNRVLSGAFECPRSIFHDVILTGSTSEGVVPQGTSDMDFMQVHNNIICVDDPNGKTNYSISIIKSDFEDAPPGYIKVVPVHININGGEETVTCSLICSLLYCYTSRTGDPYIPSSEFHSFGKRVWEKNVNGLKTDSRIKIQTLFNGPAVTLTLFAEDNILGNNISRFESDIDFVRAIYYYNSSILNNWAQRPRYYDWPPKELIKKVSNMEGFILPIGEKASENQALEWRISFVTAEKKLLLSFNSTQDKLYVVLKLFVKQVFTCVSKAFSSYMVKNVILWIAELRPSCRFRPHHFIDQLLYSLQFIKQCLQNNHLPNYIMPNRNLIACRLFGKEKQNLITFLDKLIEEGEHVIHRLPKLSGYLHHVAIYPNLFVCYGIWRHCVETLASMVQSNGLSQIRSERLIPTPTISFVEDCLSGVNPNEEWLKTNFNFFMLLVPNFIERVHKGQFTDINNLYSKQLKAAFNCCFLV